MRGQAQVVLRGGFNEEVEGRDLGQLPRLQGDAREEVGVPARGAPGLGAVQHVAGKAEVREGHHSGLLLRRPGRLLRRLGRLLRRLRLLHLPLLLAEPRAPLLLLLDERLVVVHHDHVGGDARQEFARGGGLRGHPAERVDAEALEVLVDAPEDVAVRHVEPAAARRRHPVKLLLFFLGNELPEEIDRLGARVLTSFILAAGPDAILKGP
mmetsp:Transcript_40660/g.127223  ORF Transcript_40660/g.127223 Transcript_40660/m.127223 type:complete len:210 (-) Transcript_40660:1834-2463(-)